MLCEFSLLLSRYVQLRRDRRGKKEDPMGRRRMWESSFFINSFMNLETKEQYFFYSVTFGHVNK